MSMAEPFWNGSSTRLTASLVLWGLFLCAFSGNVQAQVPQPDTPDMDLERLMNLDVTSVSGRARKVSHTASAIKVITAEDIRRAGATSLPEALRLVPGIQVAQTNSNQWKVVARGIGDRFSNKFQVLIDGRTLYSKTVGGVDWNVHNLSLEDVERIEVIRGPGAALWGGNAINGVINIITRHSRDTQGGLLTTSLGSQQRVHSNLRYGGKLGQHATYRLGAQFFDTEGSQQVSGQPAIDGGDVLQGGFRLDWNPMPSDELTVAGQLDDRDSDLLFARFPANPSTARNVSDRAEWRQSSIMARWQRFLARGDDISVQSSYDQFHRDEFALKEHRRTVSLDFRHRFLAGNRQEWLWGLGYDHYWLNSEGGPDFTLGYERGESNAEKGYLFDDEDSRYLLFVQNEIDIVPEQLFLIPGARLQRETGSGFQFQPSLRAVWTPHSRHTVWASVARALRTPTAVEQHSRITLDSLGSPNGLPTFLVLYGNKEFQPERLISLDLGYRAEPRSGLAVDFAVFYNDYGDLRSVEPETPFFASVPLPPHIEVPLRFDNKVDGETYGAEISANWRVASRWTLSGSYAWVETQLHRHADSQDIGTELNEMLNPNHQFNLQSSLQLPRNLEFNTSFYYVSEQGQFPIPAYSRLDAFITWRPLERTAITLGGQNLLDPRHPETPQISDFIVPGQAERNVFVKLAWRF